MSRLVRTVGFTVTLMATATVAANAQRGGRAGGGLPRITTAPPSRPAPVMPSRGGIMTVPRATPGRPGAQPGALPRIYDVPRGRSRFGGFGFGQPGFSGRDGRFGDGRFGDGRFGHDRFGRPSFPRRTGGCVFGCPRFDGFGHKGVFGHGFFIGFPFAYPVYVPYPYDVTYGDEVRYDEYGETAYAEPGRASSKLIVVGGGRGGGDALTVETLGDSVRLTWLASNRPAREVRLFVADSAQRPLATRSASPMRPTATFEVSTLSAPVAFAGVTVVFADSVTSTTTVPYRGGRAGGIPR
jgi:hypothetical protein